MPTFKTKNTNIIYKYYSAASTLDIHHTLLVRIIAVYRVAQNKIPQQTLCNFSATSCPILNILEGAQS